MNDPHVNALRYELVLGKNVDYKKALPLTEETPDFTFTMTSEGATFKMKKHFANENEARQNTDKYLEAYQIFVGLKLSPDEIMFNYTGADIIDRNPHNKEMYATASVHSGLEVTIPEIETKMSWHDSRTTFASPPKDFSVSPDVKTMYLRWKGYCQREEKLLSMVNFCLTVLEMRAIHQGKENNREAASRQYNIEYGVLDKLGNWAANKGTEAEARKAPKDGFIPLTNNEEVWIKEVIKRIIMRVGEYAFNPNQQFQKITLADFPPLNH